MTRPWLQSEHRADREYSRLRATRERGGETLDVYRTAERAETLVVFQHIRKTAGTSVRNVLFSNRGQAEPEVLAARDDQAWYERFWETEGNERIACLAGHSANRIVPIADRPLRLVTVVREPVDRVLSLYYMVGKVTPWPLAEIGKAQKKLKRADRFLNGQARSLLIPHYSDRPPLTADHADAPMWRDRLYQIADSYLIGLQDRLEESMHLFARELGWRQIWTATGKVNVDRPTLDDVPAETREQIAELNWLDNALYERAVQRFS